ncbi:hypothetical protein F5Y13DRAFT_176775 [Hypoxylon sp. FL1857]|nr:hypothetical protein F5Y13DRAFT_176775 [Hypoxylon sp. FL1857]
MNKLQAELLTALEDFRRIADILGQHETVLDTKSFYYNLFAQCYQLHQQVTDIVRPGSLSDFFKTGYLYPSLVALHQCTDSEHHSQDDRIKLFKECINFGTKDERAALVVLLKDSNDYLKAQASEPAVSQDIDLFSPLKARQRPPDGIWPAANSLFKVLDSRKRCTCNPAHKYVVQLCLETHRAKLANCDFDLYLGLGQVWQEARVQTTTISSSKLPTIVVDGPKSASADSGSRYRSKRERIVEKLCGDIIKITSKLPHYRLKYRLEKDSLWKLQSEESNFKIDKSKPPMSLAKIIAEKSNMLNEKTKRILSVLLGYAVFHLHGTPWLQSPWSSSNVLFFRSPSGVPLRPYIETHLDDDLNISSREHTPTDEDDEFDPDDDLSPPYPCLVDLAVVLMELHKAKTLESLADAHGVSIIDEMDTTARYIFVREVFKHCREDITDQTRMAISSCLDPNIGLNDDGEELDEHGLRGVIYQQIVRLLEDELELGFSDLSVDRLDTLVQNMDLATGGQPIRLEQLRHSLDAVDFPSKPKRRLSSDNACRRVRFLTSTDADISELPGQSSTSKLSVSACDGRSILLCDKEPRSSDISNHQNRDLAGRIKQLLTIPRERPTRPDTIRVLNVPDGTLELELQEELERLFDSTCKVHSLARTSRDTHWRKYATVTFPGLPNDKLKDLITTEGSRLRGSFNLQYDTNFLGITSLYDAGEEAMVE